MKHNCFETKKGDVMKNITMILIVMIAMVSTGLSYEKDSTGVIFTEIEIAYAAAYGWATDSANADATIEKLEATNAYNDPRATSIARSVLHKYGVELPSIAGEDGWAQSILNALAPGQRFFGFLGAERALATDTTLTQDDKDKINAVLHPPTNKYYTVDPKLTTEVTREYAEEGYVTMGTVMSDLQYMVAKMKKEEASKKK